MWNVFCGTSCILLTIFIDYSIREPICETTSEVQTSDRHGVLVLRQLHKLPASKHCMREVSLTGVVGPEPLFYSLLCLKSP